MNIKRVNLNLLIHFDTLIKERSVTKAADKSYLSQTAMSHILKQLRELFDDQLFVRKPHGLQPTQKALSLEPKVKALLGNINEVFRDEEFDPKSEKLEFKIVFTSFGEQIILPKLCAYLNEHAPLISLTVLPLSPFINMEYLLSTEIDIAIAPGFIRKGAEIHSRLLQRQEAVCVMSKNHPLADKELTVEEFLKADHVDIEIDYYGSKYINSLIKEFEDRNIIIKVPNVVNALELVTHIPCISTIPHALAEYLKDRYQIVIKPFPFETREFKINAYYHSRFVNYRPLEWLLSVIKNHCLEKE